MLLKTFSKILFACLFFSLMFAVSAQTKKKPTKVTPKKNAQTEINVVKEAPPAKATVKKNERPSVEPLKNSPADNDAALSSQTLKTNSSAGVSNENKPVYFYEFSQPDFQISQIFIEHDENGKGKITFLKKNFGETVTDPIQLSAAALERIKQALGNLDFLNSNENYQYEKDYSHLGNMKFTVKKDGRERFAKFNYTTNKDAKALADEYRKIGQQYVWKFDINVARENQPLEAPRLMDALDWFIKRDEISDVTQLTPFLRELSNDERLPLIARNHAARLVKTIEKTEEKKK